MQYILPFFGAPALDGISAIFRLTQRFIIPLATEAGKGVQADDPRNWQPAHNPLLDQQVRACVDCLSGALRCLG